MAKLTKVKPQPKAMPAPQPGSTKTNLLSRCVRRVKKVVSKQHPQRSCYHDNTALDQQGSSGQIPSSFAVYNTQDIIITRTVVQHVSIDDSARQSSRSIEESDNVDSGDVESLDPMTSGGVSLDTLPGSVEGSGIRLSSSDLELETEGSEDTDSCDSESSGGVALDRLPESVESSLVRKTRSREHYLVPRLQHAAPQVGFGGRLSHGMQTKSDHRSTTTVDTSRNGGDLLRSDLSKRTFQRASCPPGLTLSHADSPWSDTTLTGTPTPQSRFTTPPRLFLAPSKGIETFPAHFGALAERIKAEEKAASDAEWETVIAFSNIAHQAELSDLHKSYRQEIQTAREGRLEAFDVSDTISKELIRNLQTRAFTAEGTVSAREVDIENLKDDQEAEKDELREGTLQVLRMMEERDAELKTARSRKDTFQKTLVKLKKETKSLKAQVQEKEEMLRGAFEESKALKSKRNKQDWKSTEAFRLITGLQQALRAEQTETKNLKLELKQAMNDCLFFTLHASHYRDGQEDPARTADIDGLLQRKDAQLEVYRDQLAECSKAMEDEVQSRRKGNAQMEGKIQALEDELNYRIAANGSLLGSRDRLQAQVDQQCRMFEGKICHDDMVKAMCDSHDAINVDNASLIATIKVRDHAILAARTDTADREVTIVDLEEKLAAGQNQQNELRMALDNLGRERDTLRWKVDSQPDIDEQGLERLQSDLRASSDEVFRLGQELRQVYHDKLDATVQRLLATKDGEIDRLRRDVGQCRLVNAQLEDQLIQARGVDGYEFDFRWHGEYIKDWHAEDIRRRLHFAESQLAKQRSELLQEVRAQGPVAVWRGQRAIGDAVEASDGA